MILLKISEFNDTSKAVVNKVESEQNISEDRGEMSQHFQHLRIHSSKSQKRQHIPIPQKKTNKQMSGHFPNEYIVRKNSYWWMQQEKKLKKDKQSHGPNHSQNQNSEINESDYSVTEKDPKNIHNQLYLDKNNDKQESRKEHSPQNSIIKNQKKTNINISQQTILPLHNPHVSNINLQLLSRLSSSNAEAPPANLFLTKGSFSIKKSGMLEDSQPAEEIFSSSTSDTYSHVELRELLGEGAYGKVFKGFLKKTGRFIAVKQLLLSQTGLKDSSCQQKLQQYLKEIIFLNHLDHPNIVRYYDCKSKDDFLYIYMEQMPGGSVSSMLEKFGGFDESLIQKFVKQIMKGLVYLHSQGVVHRDIKGANILSDGNGTVKLADFGAARYRDTLCLPTASDSEFCNSIKGSLYWMAPELLNQEPHGRKSDIWSLGCTIIEMAAAKHPWPDCKSFPQLALTVQTLQCPPIPENLSENCIDFIRKCCTFDKKQRPSAESLLTHNFLDGGLDE